MPRHGRRDTTHAPIRDGLRAIFGPGSVHDTGDVGNGFGDLVFGTHGFTVIFEVKSGKRCKLRPGQEAAISVWEGGPWARVDSLEDAVTVVNYELAARGFETYEVTVLSRGDRA